MMHWIVGSSCGRAAPGGRLRWQGYVEHEGDVLDSGFKLW